MVTLSREDAILLQDPDIILVGEVRDVETARIAVQSAPDTSSVSGGVSGSGHKPLYKQGSRLTLSLR